jgi:stage V sporulation protein SpoVS
MAKPLGAKSLLIRDAIKAHPDKGNTALAALINGSDARKQDKITVSANDVAAQRQALKKVAEARGEPAPAGVDATPPPAQPEASGNGRKRRGRKPGRKPRASTPSLTAGQPAPARPSRPVEVLGKVFDLAKECGGFGSLKQIIDRLAGMEQRCYTLPNGSATSIDLSRSPARASPCLSWCSRTRCPAGSLPQVAR